MAHHPPFSERVAFNVSTWNVSEADFAFILKNFVQDDQQEQVTRYVHLIDANPMLHSVFSVHILSPNFKQSGHNVCDEAAHSV